MLLTGAAVNFCSGQDSGAIQINKRADIPGLTKPIPVSLDGFSGEVADVLKFDLYVQGFSFVAPDAAQYQISGSAGDNVTGTLTDKLAKKVLLSNSYTGTNLRRQAHAFANDIVFAITGKKGIGLTQIAFKAQPTGNGAGEIYVSDFDGHNRAARDARQRDCFQAVVGAGAAGAVITIPTSSKIPTFFTSDLRPASAR